MSKSTPQEFRCTSFKRAAFSLVEVAISLGITAFAFVVIFSLIPIGLNIFSRSLNTSIGSQIFQRVVNECQQSDFDELISPYNNTVLSGQNATGLKAFRFFDGQGLEIVSANSSAGDPAGAPAGLTAAEKERIVYWVNTRILPSTSVPQTGTAAQDNPSLATVTLQVAQNPGNQKLAFDSASASDQNSPLRNLWNGSYSSAPNTPVVALKTYAVLVSRSK